MTYVANTPLSTDSPGILPSQLQANFGRLETLIGADHQFNNGALANDGWHNLIHMTEQVPLPAIAGTGQLYAKSASGVTQLFYTDSAGTEHQITPESSISSTLLIGNKIINDNFDYDTILLDPGYDYTGILTAYIKDTTTFVVYSVVKTGAVAIATAISGSTTFPVPFPFFGGDPVLANPPLTSLYISITGVGPSNVYWTLNLNKAS